jgi:hypothetical protein
MGSLHRHFARSCALGAVVTAALATAIVTFAQQAGSSAAMGGGRIPALQAPDTVEVCRGACTVTAVSNPSAKFQLAETQWSTLTAPRLPLGLNCEPSCAEFGESAGPGLLRILYAQKEQAAYTVTWVDASGKVTQTTIPPLPAGANGVIAGRIIWPDGAPAAGIRVNATAISDPRGVTGKWVVPGVANGSWEIQLRVDGARIDGTVAQTVNGRYEPRPITDGYVDGATVSFKATHDRRRITFTGTVNGAGMTLKRDVEILQGGGPGRQGIFGARGAKAFVALRESNGFESDVRTDGAGQYRIDRLPPGRYRIRAGPREAPTYFPGVRSAEDADIVPVTSNATYAGRDFTLLSSSGGKLEPFRE